MRVLSVASSAQYSGPTSVARWLGERLDVGWAIDVGHAHYYRIHGPTVLIEYDNTQNDANHVHSVWHDPARDFGADLLGAHYEHGHHHHYG